MLGIDISCHNYFPTHSPLHVTYIQLGVGVSLVVLEEHVSYNDSQSAYNPTTNVIRKIQNKERIGKKIAIRVGCHATTTILPRYNNNIATLRQQCCHATTTLLRYNNVEKRTEDELEDKLEDRLEDNPYCSDISQLLLR
ncbi:hypothetical protein [Leyella stercorea]|uniref:hypothetical protein n=1 Tax=Leyella stercorea TaxID=363265 RepID=UPI00242F65CA|nr:hypothetical protein [Leyella stercorea]